MLIIWGTRRSDKPLGYVADFCPVCRDIRAFRLWQMRVAGHLMGVNLGAGRIMGQLQICESCHLTRETKCDYFEQVLVRPAQLRKLVAQTNPDIDKDKAPRLGLEQRIRTARGSLAPKERRRLIEEAFQVTSDHSRLAARIATSRPAVGYIAGFIMFGLMVSLSRFAEGFILAGLSGLLICFLYALWAVVDDNIKPVAKPERLLAVALAPLDPSVEEIRGAEEFFVVRKLAAWDRSRPEHIHRLIQNERRKLDRSGGRPSKAAR